MSTPWFRLRKRSSIHRDQREEDETRPSSVPAWVLLGLVPLAILFFWLAEQVLHFQNPYRFIINTILAHVASALIVASVIGLSYEWLVHRHREKVLREILESYQHKMYQAVQAYGKTTPKEVFRLLEDIATQTRKMPTLYKPPREQAGEYTFANSCDFFETIIKVQGTEVIELLREWVTRENPHPHLRFLASDFIGRYRLTELAGELKKRAEPYFEPERWNTLNDLDQHWILNYVWASSRCEKPKYKKLERWLLNPPGPTVPEWILFIPQQMPEDHEFLAIVDKYLEQRFSDYGLSPGLVQRSLAALEEKHPGEGKRVLEHYSNLFSSQTEWEETKKAWNNLGIPQKLKREAQRLGSESRTDSEIVTKGKIQS